MACAYRLGLWRRLVNWIVRGFLRLGVSPPHTYLLTVRGTALLNARDAGGKGWETLARSALWEVGWVRNARAANRVTLTRGRRFETVRIHELSAEHALALKTYLRQVAVARPIFDVTPRSNLRDFAAEASRHPVFRIH